MPVLESHKRRWLFEIFPNSTAGKMAEATGVRFETVFLSRNPPDDERTDQLIYWARRFDQLGLAPKSAGNLSFRTEKGFIITATGVALRAADKENLVEVLKVEIEPAQTVVYVKGRVVPSKESVLHSGIYESRSEINAVFHIHDQLVVGLADEVKLPCTQGEQPRGSYELAKEVDRVLGLAEDTKYLVLRNHGIISIGETLEEAGRLVESIHKVAQKTGKGGSK